MSPHVRSSLVVLLALAAGPVLAQEEAPTYDLRQDYKFVVGDKVRVHERTETRAKYALRAGEQVMQQVDQTEGYDQRYEEEVQEVSPEGEVTRALRTYTQVQDLATSQTLDLQDKPFKVQMTRDEDGTFRFAAVDEAAEVPELLERILEQESGRKETEADDESTQKLIMPEQPVAVGARWQVAVPHACEVFKFEPETVGQGAEAQGALKAAAPQGEQTMLEVALRFKLPLTSFNGMPCPEPMIFDATIDLRMPAGATGPDGGAVMEGTIKGLARLPEDEGMPPDAVLDLDMKVKSTKSVERVQ